MHIPAAFSVDGLRVGCGVVAFEEDGLLTRYKKTFSRKVSPKVDESMALLLAFQWLSSKGGVSLGLIWTACRLLDFSILILLSFLSWDLL